jgi:HAD superfamily hydrolase (TIGR01544 family)
MYLLVSRALQRTLTAPNVTVVSNRMHFDADGSLLHMHDEIIHTFNKNAHALQASAFWAQHQCSDRHNVLIMGDSLGDLNMSVGLPAHFQTLSVGFLFTATQEDFDARLPEYLRRFDVVITQDASLDFVLDLLSRVR